MSGTTDPHRICFPFNEDYDPEEWSCHAVVTVHVARLRDPGFTCPVCTTDAREKLARLADALEALCDAAIDLDLSEGQLNAMVGWTHDQALKHQDRQA